MKKLYSLIIAVVLILAIPSIAFATGGRAADVDLSGMSYDELVELKDRINLAIWQSEEWQEVEVPYGVWEVGKDIPAGKWTVTAGDKCSVAFEIGMNLDETNTKIKWDEYWHFFSLKSSSYKYFDPASDIEFTTVELTDGQYVTIDQGYVTFSPYSGKPSLGFN